MGGEQIVALEYLWRMNDAFYGQWCMMNIPFRSMAVFQLPAVMEKVPARYRWLATALLLTENPAVCPRHLRGYWRDPQRMTQDMECEAHASSFIEDVLAFVSAQVLAIDRYLTGQLNRAEEEAAQPAK